MPLVVATADKGEDAMPFYFYAAICGHGICHVRIISKTSRLRQTEINTKGEKWARTKSTSR